MPGDNFEEKIPLEVSPPGEAGPRVDFRPAPALWASRDLFLFLAFAVSWLILSNFLALAAYQRLKPIMGWHTPVNALEDNAYFAVAAQAVYYGPVLAYIYFLVVVRYRLPFWAGIRWRNPTGRQALLFFLEGFILGVALQFAPTLLPDQESFPLERLLSSTEAALAVGLFAVLVAPFMEELIFRGVLFAIFEKQAGLWLATVATAVLFAALHVPEYWGAWNHVLLILVVGVVFSLARAVTGSLAPSVILHLAYNLFLVIALFLEPQPTHPVHALLVR